MIDPLRHPDLFRFRRQIHWDTPKHEPRIVEAIIVAVSVLGIVGDILYRLWGVL
jgi:hypothetical protein